MNEEASDFDARAVTWDDDPQKVERALTVAAAIRRQATWKPAMRGLEFGCGTGLLGFALQDCFSELQLADTSTGMLAVLRQKIAASGAGNMHPVLIESDETLFQGDPLDMIFSLMSLHHVPDTDAALQGFWRGLAPGGQLCLADLDAEDGSFHDHDASVHNGFERDSLARRAEAAGFRKVRFSTAFTISKGSPCRDYPVFLMIAEKAG